MSNNFKSYIFLFCLPVFLLLHSCNESNIGPGEIKPLLMEIPQGFPNIVFPDDNHFTSERWELGKKLFYDKRLSVDSTLSCASCHNPEFAFADNKPISSGVKGRPGTRNSPSLANMAYLPYFTREGGVPTLEMQVLVPIQEHNEFDFNIIDISARLASDTEYEQMASKAYSRKLDYYVITRAIANFERSLISGNSAFDRYQNQGKRNELSEQQRQGMELFYSERLSCSSCHSGFNFTNNSFENNGIYDVYQDIGRQRLTNKNQDYALFKVPSLRNVAITAPYMHDGSISTLQEVIEHYNSGGKNNSQKSKLIKMLDLSEKEKEQLIAFLNSLTDYNFINNKDFYEKQP